MVPASTGVGAAAISFAFALALVEARHSALILPERGRCLASELLVRTDRREISLA